MSKVFTSKTVKITINQDDCIGCEACVQNCPVQVYEMIDGKSNATNVDSCCKTLSCVSVCPVSAITVDDI
ncbi:4Fe-4S ferredoxin iron-sulfur binding domain containing protein [Entamoeba histolytica HM-3:IMSS]|uniref:4Fe4S ferredoxin iron-sulfur binding domain containing protein n=3 Tax=Entamoeba TaxID=5758 RepID=M2S8B4_ENTHI|nr:4Fe4S ferredoxin iron-sulfur binding domain containing protein [Entamoeba histolytica KU27]EMS15206.1 4Fe-4S ferredoxin iron-sulfur binding domain containing protein [Entamoeba histolytica HM-3:IMSS]